MELQDREVCCYVCGRATDHWAEHDDLVGLGLAIYTDAGVEVSMPSTSGDASDCLNN